MTKNRSNPLIMRLNPVKPNITRWIVLFIFTLVLACWISYWILYRNNSYSGIEQGLGALLSLIFIFSNIVLPLNLGALAAILTTRDANTEIYTLMRLTPLADSKIVQGYLLTALYRSRVLLVCAIGLAPTFIAGVVVTKYADVYCLVGSVTHCGKEPMMTTHDWIIYVATIIVCLIGLWGISFLSATLSVLLGLWWRKRILATSVALGLCFALLILASNVLGEFFGKSTLDANKVVYLMIFMATPFAAGMWVMHWAARWVRIFHSRD